MLRQPELDFNITPHNNRGSELFYEENMVKFKKSCQKVVDILKTGKRLTVLEAISRYGISSLPRRAADINTAYRNAGLSEPIKNEWVRDESGKRLYKYWFI